MTAIYRPFKKVISFSGAVNADNSPACAIWYDGTASSATVANSSATLTFTSGGAATAHNDGTSTAGTLVISVATVDTMSELKTYIEAVPGWHCHLIGGKLADDFDSAAGAALRFTSLSSASCVGPQNARVLYYDESTYIHTTNSAGVKTWAVGAEADLDNIAGGATPGFFGSNRIGLRERFPDVTTRRAPKGKVLSNRMFASRLTSLYATGTEANGTHTITVDRCTQGSDGSTILSVTAATTVETTLTAAQLAACYCNPGERLVVRVKQVSGDSASTVLTMVAAGEYGEPGCFD